MSCQFKVLLLLVGITLVFHTANARQCYQCITTSFPSTCSPLNETLISPTNCSYSILSSSNSASGIEVKVSQRAVEFQCMTYSAKGNNGAEQLQRGCVYKTSRTDMCDYLKDVADMNDNIDSITDCYTCDSDGCNSATSTKMVLHVSLISALFLFFSRYQFS